PDSGLVAIPALLPESMSSPATVRWSAWEKLSFSSDVLGLASVGRKSSSISHRMILPALASRAREQCSSQPSSRSRARSAVYFSRDSSRFSQPVPGVRLGSFECQPRDFPVENFHSANAPGNLATRDRSTTLRHQEYFESRRRLDCSRLRESGRRPCGTLSSALAARLGRVYCAQRSNTTGHDDRSSFPD